MYDAGYDNWQSQIDFIKAVVKDSLPRDSRVGLVNFSGCGSNKDLAECRAEGKLNKMWGLDAFGSSNDAEAVYDRISEIDSSDFNSGYTWTNEALHLALTEFQDNSSAERSKMVIMLTDGEPYPHNADNGVDGLHEACIASTKYESNTLSALRALDTVIVAVGIDVADDKAEEYLKCMIDSDQHYFGATHFDDLSNLVDDIDGIVCQPSRNNEEAESPESPESSIDGVSVITLCVGVAVMCMILLCLVQRKRFISNSSEHGHSHGVETDISCKEISVTSSDRTDRGDDDGAFQSDGRQQSADLCGGAVSQHVQQFSVSGSVPMEDGGGVNLANSNQTNLTIISA